MKYIKHFLLFPVLFLTYSMLSGSSSGMNSRKEIWIPNIEESQKSKIESAANYLPGWPQTPVSGNPHSATPVAVGDLDGDGDNEVISMYSPLAGEAFLAVWNHDGTPYKDNNPKFAGLEQISHSAPSIGDINGDGKLEIAVGDWGGVKIFRHDGSKMVLSPSRPFANPPVVLKDINKDGFLEIIAVSHDPAIDELSLYVWDHQGNQLSGWPIHLHQQGYTQSGNSPLAVDDINNNGFCELVIGVKKGQVPRDRHILCFDYEGTQKWNYQDDPTDLFPAGIYVVIGQMNHDPCKEIVFLGRTGEDHEKHFRGVLDCDGQVLFREEVVTYNGITKHILPEAGSSLNLGDIDGNGILDVALSIQTTETEAGVHLYDQFRAWNLIENNIENFPIKLRDRRLGRTGVVLVDLNEDGITDLIGSSTAVESIPNFTQYATTSDRHPIPGFPLDLPLLSGGLKLFWFHGPEVTIDDVDKNGTFDLIACLSDEIHIVDLGVPFDPKKMEWPTLRGNYQRTGAHK